MPNSVTFGGGGGASASAIAAGINAATDIDAILVKMDRVIDLLLYCKQSPTPTLQPTIKGSPGQPIETPLLSPGLKSLLIRFSGWYDIQPQTGLIEVIGSDGLQYFSMPLLTAKVGIVSTARLPLGIGAQIKLSAGGTGCTGLINYAFSVE